jgi:hypothetical protein
VNIQQTQFQFYEDFLKLQTRISIEWLPQNFDQLEHLIAVDLYFPTIKDNIAVEFKQKRYKIIQETKRTWLNMYMDAYEMKIQEYERDYQQELNQFEFNSSSHIQMNGTTLFNAISAYMNHRIYRMKDELYYDMIPLYRRQMLRLRQRLGWPKKMVSVCPKVILDVNYHPFTTTQLAYLSRGC